MHFWGKSSAEIEVRLHFQSLYSRLRIKLDQSFGQVKLPAGSRKNREIGKFKAAKHRKNG